MKNHTMKNHSLLRTATAAAVLSMLAIGGAKAVNTLYAPGDLILYFQQPGGANTVYADVGKASDFRGTAAGAADGGYKLNFMNINTTLVSAFGPNWASDTTVYAGMAGVWGLDGSDETLQNGDPSRTLYVSKSRNSTATVGAADSSGWTINTDTGMTSAAGAIYNQNNVFAQNSVDATTTVTLTSISRIDENNPFTTVGSTTIQGTAFNIFGGGVQQQGRAGSFGYFWGAGNVEFALDLYRIDATETIPGQIPGILRKGTYEGTMTLAPNGDVSFISVPEPSALILSGLSAGVLLFRRRRSA